jgi:hypothetical protein
VSTSPQLRRNLIWRCALLLKMSSSSLLLLLLLEVLLSLSA